MQQQNLLNFLESRRRQGQSLALATVFETRGSTYSKAGARMLIDENGIFQGMLSGGCLEGDLAIRAQQVIESGKPQLVSYDLADDNDELWGLGVGCDGMMRVFLQPLTAGAGYEPFATLATLLSGDERGASATVIASSVDGILPGATALVTARSERVFGIDTATRKQLGPHCEATVASGRAALETHAMRTGDVEVLYAPVVPLPRVLILGAGLDAEPLVRIVTELGWRCTVCDHRPAYVENNDFLAAEATVCCPADDVRDQLDLACFDLAVVMSHHLASDRSYLRQLASTAIPYIGLLGPRGRRDRLLADLGADAASLGGRLHGPAGLDLGGSGPAAIALSIAAEMQQVLAERRFSSAAAPAGSSE